MLIALGHRAVALPYQRTADGERHDAPLLLLRNATASLALTGALTRAVAIGAVPLGIVGILAIPNAPALAVVFLFAAALLLFGALEIELGIRREVRRARQSSA